MILTIILLIILAAFAVNKMYFELDFDMTKDYDESKVLIVYYYWRGVRECKLIKLNRWD